MRAGLEVIGFLLALAAALTALVVLLVRLESAWFVPLIAVAALATVITRAVTWFLRRVRVLLRGA